MKLLKILSILILSTFLFSLASAMTVYADFNQNPEINSGDSISFNADFFSMSPPMTMRVQIFSPEGNIIQTWDKIVSQKTYSYINSYQTTTTGETGTYTIIATASDKINTASYEITFTVESVSPTPDTTPPVITVLGSNPVTIIQGDTYNDAGATATDNVDGDITSSIIKTGNVNTNVVDTYIITYTVSDSAGNTATKTRTVNVVSQNPTNHAPVITSSPDTSVKEGEDYDYNVHATDADGDPITYHLINHPNWLSMDSNGVISGEAPYVSSNTDYYITVEVSDGQHFVQQHYTLTVRNIASKAIGGGGSRVTSEPDIYYPNKYFDQYNPDVVLYSKPTTQNIFGLNVLVFFYILIVLISVGIVIIVFLLGRNLGR
jgi:hypothetical protein